MFPVATLLRWQASSCLIVSVSVGNKTLTTVEAKGLRDELKPIYSMRFLTRSLISGEDHKTPTRCQIQAMIETRGHPIASGPHCI